MSHHTSKRDSIALVPLLDFLNHQPNERIHAAFDTALDAFVIQAQHDYPPHAQVFLNYGPHDNQFLLVEYGFTVPNNPYNGVLVDDAFYTLLRDREACTTVLTREGLLGDYHVDMDGEISYRLRMAIRVLLKHGLHVLDEHQTLQSVCTLTQETYQLRLDQLSTLPHLIATDMVHQILTEALDALTLATSLS
jgi:hypothetical protein